MEYFLTESIISDISNIITVDDKSTWVNNCKKQVIRQINIDNDNITTTKQISCFIFDSDPNKFDISLTVSFPGIKYLISEGIGLKFKSDIIFLDFVAVVNIVQKLMNSKSVKLNLSLCVMNQ
jgi:hypothetical protein